ncbi:MAG: type II toxin-antitoxin system mRNA interferase toxin, RelE/StbE family [Nitrospirae bacterium]|nr:type II toxin-antitoxin system mRNA interferase toxin, RelE/StbE family [Nitrospirota bacterium]
MRKLTQEEPLDRKYKDHTLQGNFKDRRECHIQPDWLLI